MKTITEKDLYEDLNNTLDEATNNNTPILIKRKNQDCIIISAQEYRGLQETLYLLSSPKNAERLIEGLKEARAEETMVREMDKL